MVLRTLQLRKQQTQWAGVQGVRGIAGLVECALICKEMKRWR